MVRGFIEDVYMHAPDHDIYASKRHRLHIAARALAT